jgi:KUP system potassium uptake protein
VNAALAVGCIALVLVFQTSSKLAAAYGIAVMGTMAITSTAFFVVCIRRWEWPLYKALPLYLLFISVELTFLSSNLVKFFDGGFVPLAIGAGIFIVMRVWKRGRGLLAQHFARASKPLDEFLENVGRDVYRHRDGKELKILRSEGVAVFLTSNPTGTPPLLMHHARHNRCIQGTVLLVTVLNEKVPRVVERHVEVEPLLHGFYRVRIRVGFMETPDVPAALAEAAKLFDEPFVLDDVTYYLGRETLLASAHGDMG